MKELEERLGVSEVQPKILKFQVFCMYIPLMLDDVF